MSLDNKPQVCACELLYIVGTDNDAFETENAEKFVWGIEYSMKVIIMESPHIV